MSTEQIGTELQQRFLAAVPEWNAGDDSSFRELFHDDAVWHAGGRGRHAGRYEGRDDVVGWFNTMRDLGLQVEPQDILTDDEHFVFFIRIFGEANGRHLDQMHANAWRVRDGRFTDGFFLVDDQEEWDEATS